MCSRTSAHYIHGAGCRWSELQMSAPMWLEYIKRVRLSNCLWKSIPGWNCPRKKRILKCINRRLETLELYGMTSCRVLRTWYRMVLLRNFNQSICGALIAFGEFFFVVIGVCVRRYYNCTVYCFYVSLTYCSSRISILFRPQSLSA